MSKIILDNLGELDWISWKAWDQRILWSRRNPACSQLSALPKSLYGLPFLVAALLASGVPGYELDCGGGGLVA